MIVTDATEKGFSTKRFIILPHTLKAELKLTVEL